MNKTIYAYTPFRTAPPPYLNINRNEDGTVSFIVRSEPKSNTTEQGEWVFNDMAEITVPDKELRNLFVSLGYYLFGGPEEAGGPEAVGALLQNPGA